MENDVQYLGQIDDEGDAPSTSGLDTPKALALVIVASLAVLVTLNVTTR